MLEGRHSGHPSLAWSLITLSFILVYLIPSVLSQEFLNVSIPLNSPQLVYLPFVCNATIASSNPQGCSGAWQLSDTDPSVISTFGPSFTSANIIPQLFFSFRAFELYLSTFPSSNATVNVTISSNGISVFSVFNSSIGSATIINLPGNDTSVLTIKYISSSTPSRLDLQSINITILANATITSVLPTPTLPPSIALPTFVLPTSSFSSTTTPTPTSTTAQGHATDKEMIAEAVGLTVGLGLGLTFIAILSFYYWRRRRQREVNIPMEETRSGWSQRPDRYP